MRLLARIIVGLLLVCLTAPHGFAQTPAMPIGPGPGGGTGGGGGGSGTVTSVSVSTANGVSGVVANPTTTPAITLTLGAIAPTSVNGNTITTGTGTLTLGAVTLNAGPGGTLAAGAFAALPLSGANGGTGVANTGITETFAANFATTGAGAPTLAFPASPATYTFPTTTATLARTDAGQTFTGTNVFGVLQVTSVAIGGCTIGSDVLCTTGSTTHSGNVVVSGASFGLSGNISAAAWLTNGIRYKNVAATLTDTTSTGTVATAYTDVWGGNTIAANSAATFTNYFGAYFKQPTAGMNVTLTNAWALGADNAKIGTLNQMTVSTAGAVGINATATFADAGTWGSSGIAATTINNTIIGGSTAAAGTFTALTGTSGTINGGTLGAASTASFVSITGTWNDAGTTFKGAILANITNTASNGNSLLMDLQIGGTSEFSITRGGNVQLNGQLQLSSAQSIVWSGRGTLTSPASGQMQFGAADAASPVAQTLSFQNVVAGTSNTAGVNTSIIGSRSTGSGTSGDIIFQTGGTGAGATAQNSAVTALTIKGATQETILAAPIRLKGYTVSALPAGNTGDMAYVSDAVACTFLSAITGGGSTVCPVFYNGTAWVGG